MIINFTDFHKKKNTFEKALSNFLLFNDILDETSDGQIDFDNILQDIRRVQPKEFKASLDKSKHKEMLTDYSLDELSHIKLYKVPQYNIGFGLKDTSDGVDIVLVHNNEPTIKGIGKKLIQTAIKKGGNRLDHFDIEPLNTIYSEMGFTEYDRDKYDPTYDPNGSFANKYGKLDVIYRKL